MKTEFVQNLIIEKDRLSIEVDRLNSLIAALDTLLLSYNDFIVIKNTEALPGVIAETNTGKSLLTISRPIKYKPGYKPYYDAMEKPPTVYNDKLTQPQLVALALRNIKFGDKFEIVQHILSHDSKLDKTKLLSGIGTICSRMFIEGIIHAEKVGLRNIYYLK